jgi:hypothetical protein
MLQVVKQAAVTFGSIVLLGLLASTLAMLKLERAMAADAGDAVFTLDKVRLDVNADNAVKAKDEALREGPTQALRTIFRRLATFRAYAHLPTLTAKDADSVIEGFAVRSERNSQTRYIALIDYTFSRPKLEALLSHKGVPFFTGRSPAQTVLVVQGSEPGHGASAEDEESWWQAWRSLDLRHGLTDSRLVRAKPADNDAWRRVVAGDAPAYAQIASRYPVGPLVLVAVSMDPARQKLALRLYGQDQAGSIDYSQQIPVGDDPQLAAGIAAQVAYGILEARWREPNIAGDVVPPAAGEAVVEEAALGAKLVEETVFLRVTFNGLRDWQQMRGRLQKLPGVREMVVNSLSPQGADVRITYPGGASRLASQLTTAGFGVETSGGELLLRSAR